MQVNANKIKVDCDTWWGKILVRLCGSFVECSVPTPPVPPPPVGCGCSERHCEYTGTTENISTSGPSGDLRGLINDEGGQGSWVTGAMLPHVTFAGNVMTVKCFELQAGKRAHYLGCRQPSYQSAIQTANPATVSGNGTLRLYFSSREPMSV